MIPRLLVCHTRAMPQPMVDDTEGIPADTVQAWAALVKQLIQTWRMASEPSRLKSRQQQRNC